MSRARAAARAAAHAVRSVLSRRGLVAFLILGAAVVVALGRGQVQQGELCSFQHRSWQEQRLQIADDAKPQKPSEAILRAFPQFRPFYDERNPLYGEQIRALDTRSRRRFAILGPRPDC